MILSKKKNKIQTILKQLLLLVERFLGLIVLKKNFNKVLKNISSNLKNIKLKKDKKTVKRILKEKLSNDKKYLLLKIISNLKIMKLFVY